MLGLFHLLYITRYPRLKRAGNLAVAAAIALLPLGLIAKEIADRIRTNTEIAKCQDHDGDGKPDGQIMFTSDHELFCLEDTDLNDEPEYSITNAPEEE
ncbi:MAG: hypothetical protein AAB588_03495 [Patescibacteria group bacterium]